LSHRFVGQRRGQVHLLLHLAGVFPDRGVVRVGDWPMSRAALFRVRRALGMIFQDPDDHLFMPRVEDDVAFGPSNLGLPPRIRRSGRGTLWSGWEPSTCVPDRRIGSPAARSAWWQLPPSWPHSPGRARRPARRHRPAEGPSSTPRSWLATISTSSWRCAAAPWCSRTADGPTTELLSDARLMAHPRLEPCRRCGAVPAAGGEAQPSPRRGPAPRACRPAPRRRGRPDRHRPIEARPRRTHR